MLFPFLKTNLFFRDKVILTNLIISLILSLSSLVWLYFKIEPQVEPLALRYTIYFGIDLISPWYHVFIFPIIGFLTILVNFILAYLIYTKTKILSYFLVLTSTTVQVLLAIMSILVVLLNR